MPEVRVRFPPSPTGYLHIGGARTALYNWLFAKKHNGKLILRIEDTDTERSTQASIDGIIEGLEWLGVTWDEGPYFQTEFAAEHVARAHELIESGHAYKCFCSKEELDRKRDAAQAAKQEYGYDGTCRRLSPAEVAAKEAAGEPFVVRFRVERAGGGEVAFDDQVLGRVARSVNDIEDFVIVRSNGLPLYLLCNVVDDIRDRITHVIRGQDGLSNTPRQILLYRALGAQLPTFAHMPLTLDLNKAKISKRSHGEIVAVQFYKQRGFIPWALANFLVLLGWSGGDDREIFSREELIEDFTLERINRSNAIFNFKKDDPKFFTDPKAISINEHYLRTMPIAEIGAMVAAEFKSQGLWDEAYAGERQEWFLSTLELIRARFHTIKDFSEMGRAYFADDYEFEEAAIRKNLLKFPELTSWLPALAERMDGLPAYTLEAVEELLRAMAEELAIKPGVLINGARAVVTGRVAGPSMFEVLIAIGKERVTGRLRQAGAIATRFSG